MASTSVEEKRIQLAECSKRISRLEHELRVTRELEQQLQDEIAAAISRNPPIGKLPVEILTLVFEECTLLDSSITSTISMVCKTWRNIALNTPGLWSTIRVVINMRQPDQLPKTWQHIVTYLRNSGSVGLNISINAGLNSWNELCSDALRDQWETIFGLLQTVSLGPQDPESLWDDCWSSVNYASLPIADIFSIVHRKAIELLIGEEGQHARRWHSLKLQRLEYDRFPIFFQCSMPALERLELVDIALPDETDEYVAFPAVPALKHLVLEGSVGMWPIVNSCRNLEVYGLQGVLRPDVIAGVLMCKNLRKLCLSSSGDPYSIFSVNEATLPRLTDLYLEGVPSWMVAPFNLPSLQTLVMTDAIYLAFPQARNVYWVCIDVDSRYEVKEMLGRAMRYYSSGNVFGVNRSLTKHFISSYEKYGLESHFQTLKVLELVTPRLWLRQGFGSPSEKIDLKSLMTT